MKKFFEQLVSSISLGKPSVPVVREATAEMLQRKIANGDFDVFLCHNSKDKSVVKEIGERLKERGILPWLDEWELRPGLPWQRALELQIKNITSAAVFVGKSGIGPWQDMEQEAFIRQFVRRGCPVIPVILRDCEKIPELPPFLAGMTWVDFRKDDPNPMEQLIWGITGVHDATATEDDTITSTEIIGEKICGDKDFFTDRVPEIEAFKNLWNENQRWIFCLRGENGIGKTALLNYLRKRYWGDKKLIWCIPIDFLSDASLYDDQFRLLDELAESLRGLDVNAFQNFKNRQLKAIQTHSINQLTDEIVELAENGLKTKKRVVLIFDHYETLQRKQKAAFINWLWNQLIYKIHERVESLRVVLASQDEPKVPPQFKLNTRPPHPLKRFSEDDIRTLLSKLKLCDDYFSVKKTFYITKGLPLRLSKIIENRQLEGSVPSVRVLRPTFLNHLELHDLCGHDLLPPYDEIFRWTALLRRFDLKFLNEISDKPFHDLNAFKFQDLVSLGFLQKEANYFTIPDVVREAHHLILTQNMSVVTVRFYKATKSISQKRSLTDKSFLYDELYYDFMISPEEAYPRWRNLLIDAKTKSQHDDWNQLIELGEEVQFALDDDLVGEVFFMRADWEARHEEWQSALAFYKFSEELFQNSKSMHRAAKALFEISKIQRQLKDEERANSTFFSAFKNLSEVKSQSEAFALWQYLFEEHFDRKEIDFRHT